MKKFPDKLKPSNRKNFKEYLFNRELCKLRQKITDHIYIEELLLQDDKDKKRGGFDLKSNKDDNGNYCYQHIDMKLVVAIRKELNNLGWNTKLAYGNTTLFIYEHSDEIKHVNDDMQLIDDE